MTSSGFWIKNIKKGAAWQTQYWWHVFEKKFHRRFTKFRKILPIHFSAKKIKSYGKVESKWIFFNLYVWSANCNNFSKVWQLKFRLWHVILLEIANMSPGHKNLKSCQTNELEQSLSSPLAFSMLVNIKPYQKYTKNTQNAVFNFFRTKFGALPILQECPKAFLILQCPFSCPGIWHLYPVVPSVY